MKKFLTMLICVCMMMLILPVAAMAEEAAPNVTVDLTGVIVSVMVLVFDLILGWVAKAYLPSLKAWLDEKTTAQQQARIYDLIEKLVLAAEQIIGKGFGSDKFEYVRRELELRGIRVDREMIEAAVKEMNDKALKVVGETLSVEDTMEVELGEGVEARHKDDSTLLIAKAETFGAEDVEIEGE